jgi:hypothetical protein
MSTRVRITNDEASVRLATKGFHGAFSRLDAALTVMSNEEFFLAATECTLWLVAIDDWNQACGGSYVQARDQHVGGKTLRGLRWARNQGVHNLVAVHEHVGGMTFPASFPLAFSTRFVWRSPDGLPCVKPQANNEIAYKFLVGKEVRETLLQSLDFLSTRFTTDTPTR